MASAAEQLARNLNFSTFSKAKALQQRIWFTLGALLVYRLGTFIPVPGIDPDAFARRSSSREQGILGMFNMFAGGAVQRMAIFALNLIPYITASIVVQVIATASPRLEALKKEGEAGRRKMNQYTRYLAVVFCAVQAYGIAVGLEAQPGRRAQSGLVLPRFDRDHPGRRHHVPDVAGRADHLARRRQRYFADHLCRYRRQPADDRRADARAEPYRRAAAACRPSACWCWPWW